MDTDNLKNEERIITQLQMIRAKLVETICELDKSEEYLERIKCLKKKKN